MRNGTVMGGAVPARAGMGAAGTVVAGVVPAGVARVGVDGAITVVAPVWAVPLSVGWSAGR
ncbi:hypothetical protein GCM10023157_16930 [Gluconacetobacter asukensis]